MYKTEDELKTNKTTLYDEKEQTRFKYKTELLQPANADYQFVVDSFVIKSLEICGFAAANVEFFKNFW